jgi:phosphate transport system permease protein
MAAESIPSTENTFTSRGRLTSKRRGLFGNNAGDHVFYWGTLLFAGSVLLLCILIAALLWSNSLPAIQRFGIRFLTTSTWDPVQETFGALPFIYGTLVSSFVALLIAVPISLGTAIFLSELAPPWMRNPISFLIELLAAVPSIVYGLWGIFVLVPLLRPAQEWLGEHFGTIGGHKMPFFQGAHYGIGLMAAGLILAIMILPFITAVAREVLKAVPSSQCEAAFGLGATHWEAIRGVILRTARSGLMGAIILGLARALGETMAVTMVIGNSPTISASLFAQGYTLASVLANEFAEATSKLHVATLTEMGLILFGTTIIVNAIARLMIWSMVRNAAKGMVRE